MKVYKNIGKKIVTQIYNNYDEDARLTKSRAGQLEFFTTMEYVHKYLKKGMKVAEIGAGTGKYSIALAKEGFDVTAVELVGHNLSILKRNAKGLSNIRAYQGDALDLSRFADKSFDVVLVLGPMYHLYNKKDQSQAIDEAIRICKSGGIVMFAFIPVHSLLYGWGFAQESMNDAIAENFTEDFKVAPQTPEQGFVGFEIEDFKNLFKNKQARPLHMVATDSIMDIEEKRTNFSMTDENFEYLKKYHLATCENPTLIGMSFYALYILRCK